MLSNDTIAKRWRLPALLAAMSLLAGLTLQTAIAAKPVAPTFVDYAQCANGAPGVISLACPEGWINGILQASNSHYSEDQVTPQRAEVNVPAGASTAAGAHSMTFTYQARKGSAQTHAYDSLATWNWTQTEADRCDGLTGTDCVGGVASTYPIPDDTTALEPHTAPSGTATNTHMLPASSPAQCAAYETTIPSRCFEMYGGIIDSVSAYTHSCTATGDCLNASVDDYATITINFHTTAVPQKVQLLFGGHLAVGSEGGSRTWGSGNGASDISGGPYHIKWDAADGSSIGNRDNQIMGSAIIFNDSSTSTQVKNTNGTAATGDDTNMADGAHVNIGTIAYDTATLSGTNSSTAGGTVTYYVRPGTSCTVDGTAVSLGAKTVTNGSVPISDTYTFTIAGTYEFWAFYGGDSTHGESTSSCGSETVIVNANTTTTTTLKNTNGTADTGNDSTIPDGGSVAIGTGVYDTASLTGNTSDAGGTMSYYYQKQTATDLGPPVVPNCSSGTLISSATVTNGSFAVSSTVTITQAGTYEFWAVYSGDTGSGGSNNGSTSTCGAETLVVNPNAPAPHSTPVVNIKDHFSVTGFTADATGNVTVGLWTSSTCDVADTQIGSDTSFTVAQATAGADTSFVGVLAGTYYFRIYYAGDANNATFTSCAEVVGVTITSVP